MSYVAYSLLRISLSGLGLEEDIIRKMPMPYRNARRHIQEITEWWAYIRTETFWDSAKRGKQLKLRLATHHQTSARASFDFQSHKLVVAICVK